MMDNDFQSRLDRIGQWEIFETDWAHIRELAVMKLADLCALSVGINPQYAEAVDDLTTIDPDAPLPGNIAELAAFRNDKVDEWRRRRGVAMNHVVAGTLPIVRNAAPLGGHDPYEALPADAETIMVKIADFVAWAIGMGWKMPDEFPQPDAAAAYPVAPEGLQIGGSGDKPLATIERNTLLTIIAAFCKYESLDPAARGTATEIAKMTQDLGAPVSDDTVRRWLKMIPGAVESRMK